MAIGNKTNDDILEELDDFRKAKLNTTKPYRQFNSAFDGEVRSITEYINYSQQKFNQFVEYPEDSEDYEISLALPTIRNKLMAILARVTAQRTKIEFFPQNIQQKVDKVVADYLQMMYEWADDESEYDRISFAWDLETCIKGTSILLEDYFKSTRVVKDIKVVKDDGTTTWKKRTLTEDGLESFVLPLEECYFWNIREPNIQKQHKFYWAPIMDYEDFKHKFRNYKKVDEVDPGGLLALDDKAFYNEYLDQLTGKSVQILNIWCPKKDSFKIIANNIELTEPDNPIPFNHKKIPVSKKIYEPIAPDFIFGKSFPDITGNISDAQDQQFNDLFNLNQMRLHAPLLAVQGSVLQDTIWRKDNVVEYTGEKPEPMQVGISGTDYDKVGEILREQMDTSSVSPIGQGQVGSGSTAREVVLAEEHSNERLSMFLRFKEWAEKDRAELRMSNILQFLTQPEIKQVAGEKGKEFINTYRTIIQDNVTLENGEIGKREIRLKPEEQLTPSSLLKKEGTEEHEIVEIGIDFLQNLDFYVKTVPNSSVKMSEALQKALNMEYATTMMTLFPQITNPRELAAMLTDDAKQDPEKMLVEQEESPENQFEMMFPQETPKVASQLNAPEKSLGKLV